MGAGGFALLRSVCQQYMDTVNRDLRIRQALAQYTPNVLSSYALSVSSLQNTLNAPTQCNLHVPPKYTPCSPPQYTASDLPNTILVYLIKSIPLSTSPSQQPTAQSPHYTHNAPPLPPHLLNMLLQCPPHNILIRPLCTSLTRPIDVLYSHNNHLMYLLNTCQADANILPKYPTPTTLMYTNKYTSTALPQYSLYVSFNTP